MNEEHIIDFAASAIRQYLSEHPASADTLEGIHRWWIRWPGREESSLITLAALERLERLNEVEQIKFGSSVLWRRKQ